MRVDLALLILLLGAVTYATRIGAFAVLSRTGMPEWLRRAVRYVPVGVLVALIVPAILAPEGAVVLGPANPYFIAGIAAALAAWRTQNIVITLVAGFGTLALLSVVL